MFSLTIPSRNDIQRFLAAAMYTDLSYVEIGATRGAGKIEKIYDIDHNSRIIGNGYHDFEKAKRAIREWKMFDLPWVDLFWPDTPIEHDRTVAVLIRHFGFYSLNAARIVYVIDEPDRFGFAYGTLVHHGESGEERFTVLCDPATGDVRYDLYAFSSPNYITARIAYPLTRMLQRRFATDSLSAMHRSVSLA